MKTLKIHESRTPKFGVLAIMCYYFMNNDFHYKTDFKDLFFLQSCNFTIKD